MKFYYIYKIAQRIKLFKYFITIIGYVVHLNNYHSFLNMHINISNNTILDLFC